MSSLLTRPRSVYIPNDVRHSRFVCQECGQVTRLAWVIFWVALDFSTLPLATLSWKESERTVTWSGKLPMRLNNTVGKRLPIHFMALQNQTEIWLRRLKTDSPFLLLLWTYCYTWETEVSACAYVNGRVRTWVWLLVKYVRHTKVSKRVSYGSWTRWNWSQGLRSSQKSQRSKNSGKV